MTIENFAKELLRYEDFALFCHVRPDGDTVGSAIGLKYALEKLGHCADIFCAEAVPEKFNFLKGVTEITAQPQRKYAAYIAVDSSDPQRLGSCGDFFAPGAKNTFNFDHHVSNTHYAAYNCVIDNSSNAQNVYSLSLAMGVTPDKNAADALITGITTDTGNFFHKNTDENTLMTAAALLKAGADLNGVSYKMFKSQTKERAKLFAKVAGSLRLFKDEEIAVLTVTLKDLEETGAQASDTEGFIDFALGIDTVEVAMCIMEIKPKAYKVSFRSKRADVNAVAGTFGGGGHVLASGCMLSGYYEDVVDRLVYACKQHMS